MDGLHITAPGAISTTEKNAVFENENSVKVKVTKTLFIEEDFQTFLGDPRVEYPIIPGRIAIGKVVETSGNNPMGYERGMTAFLHPTINCNSCHECTKGNEKKCVNFQIAGKNTDGFLRDFAIMDNNNISILPQSVSEKDALYIAHVAIATRIIDQLNFGKGDHVIIVGGDVLGLILAQLIIYYQGVPILVDNNQQNLALAEKLGIYYPTFADNRVEKTVAEITGARLAPYVVYMTGSNLNTDIALKLAGHNATVCFAGFGNPNVRVNFNIALLKQLNFNCVTNGFGAFNSAINLIANKAINTDKFEIQTVKSNDAIKKINEMGKGISYTACQSMLIIEMDKF